MNNSGGLVRPPGNRPAREGPESFPGGTVGGLVNPHYYRADSGMTHTQTEGEVATRPPEPKALSSKPTPSCQHPKG